MSPRRVLVFCGDRGIPALGPSGASHHLREVAGALIRAGNDVTLATPREADHRGVGGSTPARRVHREPRSWRWLGPWRERGETFDARSLAARAAPLGPFDGIWERHALFVDAGQRLARRTGVPRWVELNAPLSLERGGTRDTPYARRLERDSLRSADRVLAVSRWLVDWAVSEVGCEPGRVLHVPNGTSVRPGDRDAGRRALGLDGPIALWVGSCKPWHGLERLVPLLEALPEWTLVAAGSGPVEVPGHPRIRAVGRQTGAALDDLLAAADVGLSLADPAVMPWVCPLKILDYRAAGLPVVATDAGDARERVGGFGVVLDDWTTEAAAEATVAAAALERQPSTRTWDDVIREVWPQLLPQADRRA